ncbi:uncharacterized protein SPPG_06135 [Spizellomyces punctatus DAOM BR117]|uniref:UBZ4-type domain-containing protein n=1 Tax=Spizellomyces punctatus (strain DAOM BR117) TaxID=645134 RepID=A0A0L0HBW4_SPIPD|nr:uncharacterized protein SPPG_06135 [Spizellomyces punctatus DAOM BR117]KNC98431.1 hypothetical protein SPPG_06135 [Spizellomyces punctatus DAOM BR117]|eukprot:XP_016606471.1 hypothetical protein SPPG_06135 [Spizellomyces punctatus DAOM BR117]
MTCQLPSFGDLPIGKRIPDTSFAVDAFKYKTPEFTYFLSHFHQDHYGGITKNWTFGPIHCSPITAKLLAHVLQVPSEYIKALPIDEPFDLGNGHTVRLLDANHCPGAVVFVFDGNGRRVVHCGDFRYRDEMRDWPGWKDAAGEVLPVEDVMLDTTYCNPRFKFPKQDTITEAIGDLILRQVNSDKATTYATLTADSPNNNNNKSLWDHASTLSPPRRRKTLFVVATYTIGKEKVLQAISDKCDGLPVYVTPEKREILALLELEYAGIFVTDPKMSPIHVVSWGMLGEMAPGGWKFLPNWSFAQQYLDWMNSLIVDASDHYTHLTGIVPTGWTWEFQRQHGTSSVFHNQTKTGQEHLNMYEVPYSEHSNFEELRSFIEFLRPARVIPTVVGKSRNEERLAAYFRDLVDAKRRHEMGFTGLFGVRKPHTSQTDNNEGEPNHSPIPPTPPKPQPDSTPNPPNTSTSTVCCPICSTVTDRASINSHLDTCLITGSISDEPTQNSNRKRSGGSLISPKLSKRRSDSTSSQTKLSAFFLPR